MDDPASGPVEKDSANPGMHLELLRCGSCQAAVPLADRDQVSCPYCKAVVSVPTWHRKCVAERRQEENVRRQLEECYMRVARPPPEGTQPWANALLLLMPVAFAVVLVAAAPRSTDLLALLCWGVVPAMMPGAVLGIWGAATHATIVRFERALAWGPPERKGGPRTCRQCGAPLEVAPGALSSRCPYCETDNLVVDVAADEQVDDSLRKELRTLAEATAVLKLRRRLFVIGPVVVLAVLGLLMASIARMTS